MWNILGSDARLCDGVTRRDVLRFGGLSAFGLTLPHLLQNRSFAATEEGSAPPRNGNTPAKNCIVLFLMGGPSQHSTWDPKPEAPAEIRGEFGPISTSVPGLQLSELFPRTARLAHRICVLRAVSSGDNAHSSSGYYMLTGRPHTPMNFENANPGPPNDFPSLGAVVRRLNPTRGLIPSSITLPHHIFNTDGSVWPGQDAGFLGQTVDPWIVNCTPADKSFRIQGLSLPQDMPALRLSRRESLLRNSTSGVRLSARARCSTPSTLTPGRRLNSCLPAGRQRPFASTTSRRRSAIGTADHRSGKACCWRGD